MASTADIVIRNARIIDGTGGLSQNGDVAVAGDRIVAVSGSYSGAAASEMDGSGLAVAPGFIDAHTHDDRLVLADPAMTCKVSQGVTTVVTGNCGVSIAPVLTDKRPPAPLDLICPEPEMFFATFVDYFAALEAAPPATNVVAQVGHSALRLAAMGHDLDRPATDTEIARMTADITQAMEDGAAGFSTGLFYPPANAAPTEEVVELAKIVGQYGAFHSTHMRDEGAHVLDSLAETFRIGREGNAAVVISHHKCSGLGNHGQSPQTLAAIEAARGVQRVGLDAYPYIAGSTMLAAKMAAGAERTIVTWSVPRPDLAGRDLADVAAELGVSQEEAAAQLSPAGGIYFMMKEDDVRRILSYPATMIGSDGIPHDEHPHPRLWGTFPRVLGHYSREVGLFDLETAVHKMTGLTAQTFGIQDRGVLRDGAYADLVLFDPGAVIDTATFETPKTPAAGIAAVIVNGAVTWRDGAHTGARAGRPLRRSELARLSAAA